MHVLVTGANGFVGAALCRKLTERRDTVRGLVRKTSDLTLLEGLPVQLVVGSLEDASSLAEAVGGSEVVYHVAASVTDWGTPEAFRRVNVEGTRSVLEAAVVAGVRRFVLVSSVAVHSFIGARDMDEDAPQFPTRFPYCQSKREAEDLVRAAHRSCRIETVIVRPGDVYGPGDRVSLLKMAGMLESGRMGLIAGGKRLGAFTYVENLADGLVLAGAIKSAAGEAFVITDGIELTWRDYFRKLTAELDLPGPRFSVPPSVAAVLAAVLEGVYTCFRIRSRPPLTRYLAAHLSHDVHFCIDKARRILGYHPAVNVDEAIRRTAVWYRRVVRGERPSANDNKTN